MRINNDVTDVLANSRVQGTSLFLPSYQLQRSLYTQVNKVLTAIGGKWNRKAKAHLFDKDPSESIEAIIQTGEYTNEKVQFQFFETPVGLACKLVDMAELKPNETVCEPSAGRGRIAEVVNATHDTKVDCVELNDTNYERLITNGFNVAGRNFLGLESRYDVFIANPPFTRQQDIDHVNRMLDLANRRVVAVMSASVLYRTNTKASIFRERVESLGGTFETLPSGTFKESGTMVETCVLVVDV